MSPKQRSIARYTVLAGVLLIAFSLTVADSDSSVSSRIAVTTPGSGPMGSLGADRVHTDNPATGAPLVGSAAYAVPANSLFVSPSGSDSASGSQAAPFLDVQHAVDVSSVGQTIVMRAGSYHQRVTVLANKQVTIMPFPHEAVWFDGSVVVSGWNRVGSTWIHDGWTAQFDSSPTFTKGASSSLLPAFDFIDPKYPLAAHPDQVWLNDNALTQVATAADVQAGTFAVDYANHRLVIGSDPTNSVVRASDLGKAIAIQGAGSSLKGVGIRRFATSLPQFGAITVEAPSVTLEDLDIVQNATTGLFLGAADIVVSNVTASENGLIGVNANYADNLRVSGLVSEQNNLQRFNPAPVSGGMKLTRSRGVSIADSSFSHNLGQGLWFDQSSFGGTIIGSTIEGNLHHGLAVEISSNFTIAGNIISGNGRDGIKINNSAHVQIWNNTVMSNAIDLIVVQDKRRSTDLSIPGHDPRRAQPDPKMTWVVSDVVVANNVIADASENAVVVQDNSMQYRADQLGVTLNGNAYQSKSVSRPPYLLLWGQGSAPAHQYSTVASIVAGTRQESQGVELPNASAARQSWLTSSKTSASSFRSRPAPSKQLIALLGWESNRHRSGAD